MSNQLYVVVGNRGFEPSDTDGVVPWLWDSSEGAKLKANHLNKFESTKEYYPAAVFIVRKEWVEAVQSRTDEIERLRAENERLRDLLDWAYDTLVEINPSNYDHDDVCSLNAASVEVALGISAALQAKGDEE